MKTKLTVLLMSFLLLMQGFTFLEAQVTIGNGSMPEKGALLELKEKNATNPDANNILSLENSFKGFLYPKVSLKAWNQLTPLYGGTDDGNGNWTDESTDQEKLLATGMVVYNVNEDALDLDEGLYMWRIEEWVKLSGGMGQAQFDPVDCSDVKVNGYYVEGQDVAGSEYLTIKLNVKKEGSFAISGTTGNGYSFYVSGVALEKGPLVVNVPCQGTPSLVQTDNLILTGIELVAGCTPQITVNTATATYTINCSNITVAGKYLKGTSLTTSNTITVSLNVSVAGSYAITTPVTNGISFSNSGELSVGNQIVTLYGNGNPTVNNDFPITINTNSPEGNTTCSTVIPVTLPAMTYAIIGSGDYSWNNNYRKSAFNSSSFGPNGSVRIERLTQLWETSDVNTAATRIRDGYTGGGFTNAFPDIVLYFAYGATPNSTVTTQLAEYVKKGGVLIYGTSDNTASAANTLIQGIFGVSSGNAVDRGGSSNQNVYQINNLLDDPIVNGPFGNLANQFWGEDNSGTVYVTNLPANSIQVCSARNQYANRSLDSWNSVVWYNDSKNFVYFGDSVAAAWDTNTSTTGWASLFQQSTGLPKYKKFGYWDSGTAGTEYAFNAALELNCVAWGLHKAASAGINPH